MEINDFIQIEKKYNLYHLEVDGVQPWIYYRMKFWNYQLCKNILALSDTLQKSNRLKDYINQLKSAFSLVMRGNRKQICEADIVFYAHPRRVKTNGYYECIYTDRLAGEYSRSVVIEDPFRNRHLTPVQVEHIYYTDLLQIKAVLRSCLHRIIKTRKYKNIYIQIKDIFGAPLEEIGNVYHYTVCFHDIYKALTRIVLENQILENELGKVLQKTRPKIIVEVVYYNKRCMLLNELAKERGIPTVELQHGTMHEAHAAYQFAENCGEIKQFPDYVFVFSEYWKRYANLPIPAERVKVTGYPFFEEQLYKYNVEKNGGIINIIFVSQGTIGIELSRLAADVSELLDESKYHIIYKLHPGEYDGWKTRNPWLIKDNIEVVDSLEHNIYEYFAKCNIQVGVYSTAIYEGLGFGLETYIYNVGHADTMKELCDQGYAIYVNNAEELCAHISSMDMGRNGETKEFWKMNSFENICHEIDQLLES